MPDKSKYEIFHPQAGFDKEAIQNLLEVKGKKKEEAIPRKMEEGESLKDDDYVLRHVLLQMQKYQRDNYKFVIHKWHKKLFSSIRDV